MVTELSMVLVFVLVLEFGSELVSVEVLFQGSLFEMVLEFVF
jgi:hypothetical protein